ncbi:MT-A70 family methyltransferase [Cellulosimicrobium cellulans]|uniref:MT-A70 family methyltransferase n=1 Tax=Cellulosimicrobium cellulans TaxID=1710 RepID=UPI003649D2C2
MTSQTVVSPLRPNDDIPQLPEVAGGFKTILADPPWRFANRTGKVAPEHRRLDRYSTLSLDDICALPVSERAAKNAHLYLWVPNALLPDGLRVMEAWGFRYVSNVVWAKRRKDGGPDGRGVGFYFRNVTELILFGVRGSMRTEAPARSMVNMIESRKREHSRKPDEQYPMIEAASPGPYLEMFARQARAGWHAWGDESAPDDAQRGQVHRGYTGGPIEVPAVSAYERIEPSENHDIAVYLRARYEAGCSIRALMDETGYTHQRVRGLLRDAGTTLRGRGRPRAS